MNKLIKYVFFIIIGLCLQSCERDTYFQDEQEKHSCTKNCKNGTVKTIPYSSSPNTTDWYIIDTAYTNNKELLIDVFYNGGCVDHCWELVWREEIIPINDTLQKTFFSLDHCNPNDSCNDLLVQRLIFDISFIDQLDTTGQIVFSIDQYVITEENYETLYIH